MQLPQLPRRRLRSEPSAWGGGAVGHSAVRAPVLWLHLSSMRCMAYSDSEGVRFHWGRGTFCDSTSQNQQYLLLFMLSAVQGSAAVFGLPAQRATAHGRGTAMSGRFAAFRCWPSYPRENRTADRSSGSSGCEECWRYSCQTFSVLVVVEGRMIKRGRCWTKTAWSLRVPMWNSRQRNKSPRADTRHQAPWIGPKPLKKQLSPLARGSLPAVAEPRARAREVA